MQLGARQFFAARKAAPAWTNPYVTDGLVAMWDGEWNAGGGAHDANATVWKDLYGTNDLRLYGNCSFGSNKLILGRSNTDAAYVSAENSTTISSQNGMTVEYVIHPTAFHDYSALVQFLPYAQSREGWIYRDGNAVPLRWGLNRSNVLLSADTPAYVAATISPPNYVLRYYHDGYASGNSSTAANKSEIVTISFFGANGYYFWGDAYCMRIYSRALTAAEIAANYAIDKARFNLP